jgi:hypothetical protein
MPEDTRNPDTTVFLSEDCIAAIKAAVAKERARYAAIVRSRIGASAEIIAQAIERDGPPQPKEASTRDWRDAAF